MAFKDLKSAAGLKELNEHLASSSYINGYLPSDSDNATFGQLGGAPKGQPHALRWYNHIASFTKDERAKWPSAGTSNGTAGGDDDDDEDIDLFGDSDEDEEHAAEKEKIKQERLAAYAAKKAKKPGVIAKSSVVLDVKPLDDETDLGAMEKQIRDGIKKDGLIWGAAKQVPIAFGIKKLQIGCVVEDDKVSIDELQEQIEAFEDYVQSVDIAAFNKI